MRDAIALIVSNVVGVGIFTTPAIIANLVPSPMAMLALWVIGGCLALAGAMSYAELAKICPEAGGEYVYLSPQILDYVFCYRRGDMVAQNK
jgi:APA family basic amino acid/polyamine antiporter